MKNEEFNLSSEEWKKAPSDEKPTLLGKENFIKSSLREKEAEEQKKKRKRTLFEKGNALIASACVVAVVAVSGISTSVSSYICSICGRTDCEYWNGYEGHEQYEVSVDGVSLNYGTNRPSWNTLGYYTGEENSMLSFHGIRTSNGSLAVLTVNPVLNDYSHRTWTLADKEEYARTFMAGEDIGQVLYIRYGQSSESESSDDFKTRVELMQLDESGKAADPYTCSVEYSRNSDLSSESYRYVSLKSVSGCDNVYVRVSSNISQDVCDELLEKCTVTVIPAGNQIYYLGDTLQYTESSGEEVTGKSESTHWGYCLNDETSLEYILGVDGRRYNIGGYAEVYFLEASLSDINARMAVMEEDAPKYGHTVAAQMRQLDDYTVNGISYHTFLNTKKNTYTKASGDTEEYYDTQLIFAPIQEENIAFVCTVNQDDGKIDSYYSWKNFSDDGTVSDLLNVLSHVTMLGEEYSGTTDNVDADEPENSSEENDSLYDAGELFEFTLNNDIYSIFGLNISDLESNGWVQYKYGKYEYILDDQYHIYLDYDDDGSISMMRFTSDSLWDENHSSVLDVTTGAGNISLQGDKDLVDRINPNGIADAAMIRSWSVNDDGETVMAIVSGEDFTITWQFTYGEDNRIQTILYSKY